jgi:phage/plasmid-associated DNA primase
MVWDMPDRIPDEELSDTRRDAMLKEGSGVLNKLIAGLSRLRKRGKFDFPLENNEAKHLWILESNPVALYLEEMVEVDMKLPVSKCLSVCEVHTHYTEWASYTQHTQGRYILGQKEFSARMADKGHPRSGKVRGKIHFLGVKKLRKVEVDSSF